MTLEQVCTDRRGLIKIDSALIKAGISLLLSIVFIHQLSLTFQLLKNLRIKWSLVLSSEFRHRHRALGACHYIFAKHYDELVTYAYSGDLLSFKGVDVRRKFSVPGVTMA